MPDIATRNAPGADRRSSGKRRRSCRGVGHNGIDDLGRAGRVTLALAVGGGDLGDDHDLAIGGGKRRRELCRKGTLRGKAENVLVKGEWCERG